MAEPVTRALIVHPLVAGSADAHQRWGDELRQRRVELEASRRRVGIVRQVQWAQPGHDLTVLRVDGVDPLGALHRLERSAHPFDRWYREREHELHGGPPVGPGRPAPELLTEYRAGEPGELDMFIATALPLLPGRGAELRSAVAVSTGGGAGLQRVRRWGLKRLAIWYQRTDRGEVVIYESVGDIPTMVRSLANDQDPVVAEQRAILDRVFGLDLARSSFPVPIPAFAWSSDGAVALPPPTGTARPAAIGGDGLLGGPTRGGGTAGPINPGADDAPRPAP